jgi:predicted nucleic acid-binding protein
MTAVDTNIVLYVQDPRDPRKQEIAAALIRSLEDGVLLWQVACEYVAASRKLAGLGFNAAAAWRNIDELRRYWPTAMPTRAVLARAQELMESQSISFWDALLCAACLEVKVTRLYSEDFSHQARVGGLEIVNPFVAA